MLHTIRLSLLSRRLAPIAFILLALIACLARAPQAHAGTIVNDTWLDGTDSDPASPAYSEYGVDSDSDGNLESAWFQGGGGTLDPVGTGGPERGSGFGTSSASWTTYFTPAASPVTLANTGDFVKVTWAFKTGDVNATNTSQNFRFALVNSASRLTANGSPPSTTYAGYSVFGNMGETTGNSNSFQLRERTTANSDLLSTSGNWAALANGLGNSVVGYADNTLYTLQMTLTRNASAGLDIVATMTGGNIGGTGSASVSFTDSTPNTFVYDTFGIRPSSEASTATVFDTTLFKVETNTVNVPEPASFLLLSIGSLAIACRRRAR
jgi:hypothetical protein